jgi:alkylation response protein AidB-like acyl-CoA dehydrogenase
MSEGSSYEVTVEAVQVLGGFGYVNDSPVERMMQDAKITQMYEGRTRPNVW